MDKDNKASVNQGDIKVIMNDIKNICGWLKSIDHQVKITNGTVKQHDTDIALIIQWKKIKEKAEDKLEMMSRGKFLAIITAVLAVAGGIFLYVFKRIIENMLG